MRQDFQVLAHGRLADAELIRDQHPANAILDQIAVDLGRKVLQGGLQPPQNEETALVGESPYREHYRHIAN